MGSSYCSLPLKVYVWHKLFKSSLDVYEWMQVANVNMCMHALVSHCHLLLKFVCWQKPLSSSVKVQVMAQITVMFWGGLYVVTECCSVLLKFLCGHKLLWSSVGICVWHSSLVFG
jgi:hypothetical protein